MAEQFLGGRLPPRLPPKRVALPSLCRRRLQPGDRAGCPANRSPGRAAVRGFASCNAASARRVCFSALPPVFPAQPAPLRSASPPFSHGGPLRITACWVQGLGAGPTAQKKRRRLRLSKNPGVDKGPQPLMFHPALTTSASERRKTQRVSSLAGFAARERMREAKHVKARKSGAPPLFRHSEAAAPLFCCLRDALVSPGTKLSVLSLNGGWQRSSWDPQAYHPQGNRSAGAAARRTRTSPYRQRRRSHRPH